jgi:hypothetical protein
MALVCLAAGAAFLVTAPGGSASASEQVVFSNQGVSTSAGTLGFWIWCEADSENPYQGECNGSIHFGGLPSNHVIDVDGSLTELAEGQYSVELISSRDNGASVDCTLTNETLPVASGPNNDILVSCTHPSVTTTASGSVVRVTG